jgi:hypothetical protein
MSVEDAGVGVFAYDDVPGPPAPELRGALALGPRDRKDMEGFPPQRAVYSRMFTEGGRQVQVIVEFGSPDPSAAQLARMNEVLRTLSIGPK